MSSSQTSANTRLAVQGPWSAVPEDFQNTQFLRSWFEYDSSEPDSPRYDPDASKNRPRTGINWNLILGIGLVIGTSVGFWVGAVWLVARFWK